MTTIKMHLEQQSPVGPGILAFGSIGTTIFNAITQMMPDFVTAGAGFAGIAVSIYTILLLRSRLVTERLKQDQIRSEMKSNCPNNAHCTQATNNNNDA